MTSRLIWIMVIYVLAYAGLLVLNLALLFGRVAEVRP